MPAHPPKKSTAEELPLLHRFAKVEALIAALSVGGFACLPSRPVEPKVDTFQVTVPPESPKIGLMVAAAEPDCPPKSPRCEPDPKGARCSNGSRTDCNVKGGTVNPTSAWVDPRPPRGWQQCAGFVNTEGDDVEYNFLDNCLRTTGLRLRVFGPAGELEEDIATTDMPAVEEWPNWNYLLGTPTFHQKTYWGDTTFFTATNGKDACLNVAAPNWTTFGSGNAQKAIIAGGNRGADEYRLSCLGAPLPNRNIALYRSSSRELERASEDFPKE